MNTGGAGDTRAMSLFHFDRVTVRFGDTVVLDEVSAVIADGGSITCLLGPSGSGKSTMLRLCNRLEVPTEGCIRFRGADIASEDPLTLRRRVGMVFQRPTVFPGTVRDNLLVAQPEASADACAAALDRAHVESRFLDRDADALSGGEAQRVCLARTLITDPEVLLMDEPTSALDPAATRGLETLGVALAADGMPVVWVTHDLDQADRIADERIVLTGGRIADDHESAHYFAGEEADHRHEAAEGDDDGQR
ncbi:ABC transporter ATP-binding protein [Actinospongicola halichondriae]|uniref:ABC transporter ATP-binding protein n=1 Tax=Actinospongicola halichondriae TaxID=3236844 RepID=UPI003D3E8068